MREAILAVVFLATFSGVPIRQPTAPSVIVPGTARMTLGVPLIVQLGHYWCWAACTEMCMQYYHDSINRSAPVFHQCELGKLWFAISYASNDSMLRDTSKIACSDRTAKTEFDLSGVPFMPPLVGTSSMPYYWCSQNTTALTWEQLRDTFALRRPVIFTWGAAQIGTPSNTGNHFLVAEGCSWTPSSSNRRWVSINDPYALQNTAGRPIARHSQIAYHDYAYTTKSKVPWNKSFVWQAHGADYVIHRRDTTGNRNTTVH